MTLLIKANGASFSKYAGLINPYPIASGLAGNWYFGSSGSGRTNLVNGTLATVIGSPTINARSITASKDNCYETALSETQQYTFVAVAKMATGDAPLITNFSASGSYGSLLYMTSTSLSVQLSLTDGIKNVTLEGVGTAGEVAFVAVRVNAATAKLFRGAGGVIAGTAETSPAFAAARSLQANPLRLGGHYYPGLLAGNTDIYAAAIHSQWLSDADILTVYQHMRSYYAARGVTVK